MTFTQLRSLLLMSFALMAFVRCEMRDDELEKKEKPYDYLQESEQVRNERKKLLETVRGDWVAASSYSDGFPTIIRIDPGSLYTKSVTLPKISRVVHFSGDGDTDYQALNLFTLEPIRNSIDHYVTPIGIRVQIVPYSSEHLIVYLSGGVRYDLLRFDPKILNHRIDRLWFRKSQDYAWAKKYCEPEVPITNPKTNEIVRYLKKVAGKIAEDGKRAQDRQGSFGQYSDSSQPENLITLKTRLEQEAEQRGKIINITLCQIAEDLLERGYTYVTHGTISPFEQGVGSIELISTEIEDLGVVTSLELRELNISNINLLKPDLNDLRLVPGLQSLTLDRVTFAQRVGAPQDKYFDPLNALGDLKELRNLNLINVKVSDAKALEKLVQLRTFSMPNSPISERGLESLSKLTHLYDLKIDASKLRNLKELGSLPAFRNLRLTKLPKLKIQFRDYFTRLRLLEIPLLDSDQADQLASLYYFEHLNVAEQIDSKTAEKLSKLARLQVLKFSFSGTLDLGRYSTMQELKHLTLIGDRSASISKVTNFGTLDRSAKLIRVWLESLELDNVNDLARYLRTKHSQLFLIHVRIPDGEKEKFEEIKLRYKDQINPTQVR